MHYVSILKSKGNKFFIVHKLFNLELNNELKHSSMDTAYYFFLITECITMNTFLTCLGHGHWCFLQYI